jgi:gluconate kinase, SKI family (EC 2.7.1.12)
MGASGCGKSTVGSLLAERLVVPFIDADDLHSPASVAKMSQGIPLSGDDRRPWLEEVGLTIRRHEGRGLVVACSALRVVYRDIIRSLAPETFFVHLAAPADVLSARLVMRPDHFMPVSLLASQLQTLEPLRVHESGVTVSADQKLDRIVREAQRSLGARKAFA